MNSASITLANGELQVPNFPIIPFIEGDGIGPDIWRSCKRVLDAAIEKVYQGTKKIQWQEILAGEKAFKQRGEWLPTETVNAIKKYLVAIKGPLTTPIGGGIRSLNVALRQELDLYVCLRPIRWFDQVPSPVKHPEKVNMIIFRENTEDIYAGIECAYNSPEAAKLRSFIEQVLHVKSIRFPDTTSFGIKPVSKEGSTRLIRAALQYACDHRLPSVTLVHKGNIMKFTEGGFKNWGYELAQQEFAEKVYTWQQLQQVKQQQGAETAKALEQEAQQTGKVFLKDIIADNFLQQILLAPEAFSVIATRNLNGDYISDALAASVGGIGISPGANINYQTGHALFEATHGTAPQFANTDSMNPSSLILSGVMMLEYLGWQEAAELIVKGLTATIAAKQVTVDFYQLMEKATLLKGSQFADQIIQRI